MALFVVVGSGLVNLSDQVFQGFEGISWQTNGDLHVILKDTQFGLLALQTDSTFQGSAFIDSVEIGISRNATFLGSSFTLAGWSVTDSFTFLDDSTGNENITGTQGSDRFILRGGIDNVDGNIGTDDLLVLRYGAATTGFSSSLTTITDFSTTGVNFRNIDRFNVTVGSGNDNILTGAGYDVVRAGGGNDIVNTGLGNAQVFGGTGNDQWIADLSLDNVARVIDVTLTGVQQAGGSTYEAIERLGITSGIGNDLFITRSGTPSDGLNDTLNSGGGNDTLRVGGGLDIVDGGAGTNDLLIFDVTDGPSTQAFVMAAGNTQFTNLSNCNVSFTGIERFDLRLSAGNDNILTGAGSDTINGNGGNDILNSAAGVAVIDGGDGNDLWQADFSDERRAKVIDLSLGGVQGAGAGTTYASIERLGISGGIRDDLFITITGTPSNGLNDTLNGGAGDDTLQVGGGLDSVIGGDGDDLMIFDVTGGPPEQAFGMAAGNTQFTNFSNCNVTFTGIERFDLRLSAGNDNILTGAGADTLNGNGGNDTLNSAAGAAVIDGGAGNDLWQADFTGDAGAKVINLSLAGLQTAGNGSTYSNIERLGILGGAGDDLFITITGTPSNGLNDTLNGGAGNDTLQVGGGSDSVIGGDGDDLMVFDVTGGPPEQAFFMAGGNSQFTNFSTCNVTFTGIERFDLRLSAGNDNILTGAGSDTINGGGGNDLLNSGAGAVVIDGGAGNDLWQADFTGDASAKVINLNLTGLRQAGNDTSYVRVERMAILGGAGDDVLTSRTGDVRDGLNDTLDGGAGNDRLVVGGGSDSVFGGLGDDVLVVNYANSAATTSFNMFAGEGGITDFSVTSVRFDGIERLDLSFGAGRDTIIMGAGEDRFRGGAGNDTVTGGLGADLIAGNAGNDVFVYRSTEESGGANRDTITDFVVGQDRIDLTRIDAVLGGGFDRFNFIDAAAFTSVGQLRVVSSGGNTLVQVNTQGGLAADMQIILQGVHVLTTADFLL